MKEVIKNEKIEEYWKEVTIELPKDEEFTYVVQNKNTNCIFIRNHSDTTIMAGAKPCSPEVALAPGNNGVVSRPFPLRYIYLRADKPCAINLIETVSQDPVANILQQEVTNKVNIQNTVLSVIQEDAFKILSVFRTSTAAPLSATLDTGALGRPIVNINLFSNAAANFTVDVSNDAINFFRRTSTSLDNIAANLFFNDNAFRFIRVATNAANNNRIVISATR